jgi:uncharacterized protein
MISQVLEQRTQDSRTLQTSSLEGQAFWAVKYRHVNIFGSTIVITGASSGIGKACARVLASAGAKVILLARNQENLEVVKLEIEKIGGQAWVFAVDLGDQKAVAQVASEIQNQLGTPNAIIHSAGAGRWLWLEETPPEEAKTMMDAPFFGALWLTQAFLPAMLEQRQGQIVFIGSPAAWVVWSGATVYAASRWALRGLYEALRADLKGTGVGVSMVVPGQVKSPYFEHNPGVTERFPSLGKYIPIVTPEEVARAVKTALTRESRMVVLPWLMNLFLKLNQILPRFVEWLVVSSSFKRKE